MNREVLSVPALASAPINHVRFGAATFADVDNPLEIKEK